MSFRYNLGDRVKDVVTNFQGIVMGRCDYLTGCEQILVSPAKIKEDGDFMPSKWLDQDRLKLVKAKAVKLAITAPGPDLEAPVK